MKKNAANQESLFDEDGMLNASQVKQSFQNSVGR